jgi:membrane protein implicated in regulation of membrane protease activity
LAGWVIWLLIAGGLFIAEMLSLTFYLLWLRMGALSGAFAAFVVPDSLWIQVVIAAIVSLLLILYSKPISKKIRMGKGYRDAVDTLVGKTAIVTQDIENGVNGIVKVGGDEWSATADEPIARGETVTIVERRSTVLYVKKYKQ